MEKFAISPELYGRYFKGRLIQNAMGSHKKMPKGTQSFMKNQPFFKTDAFQKNVVPNLAKGIGSVEKRTGMVGQAMKGYGPSSKVFVNRKIPYRQRLTRAAGRKTLAATKQLGLMKAPSSMARTIGKGMRFAGPMAAYMGAPTIINKVLDF